MKYNLENSLIAKRNDKDINLLLESTNNINNYMESLIAILVMKHLPLINNIDEAIKDEKIILIYEDDLKNAKVRFVEEKGVVYINVTPFTKKKELTGGKLEYNASTNELYSLLIGAYVTLNHNTLTNDREYVSDMVDIYLEVIPKVFVKGGQGYFDSVSAISKLHFLLAYFLLSKNNTTIRFIEEYAVKKSKIRSEDLDVLKEKYDLENLAREDYTFNELLENILKEEFSFLNKFNTGAILYNMSLLYGASNTYMIDTMSTLATIAVDYIQGNRPQLNVKYGALKGIIKSNIYNNIISVLN